METFFNVGIFGSNRNVFGPLLKKCSFCTQFLVTGLKIVAEDYNCVDIILLYHNL